MDHTYFFDEKVRGSIAVTEDVESKRYRQAYRLLPEIIDSIGYGPFTIEDVRNTFNVLASEKSCFIRIRWGESHLQTLVEEGILTFDEETQEYEVDPTSVKLANYLWDNLSEEEELKRLNPYRLDRD